MAKILISPLGAGALNSNNIAAREYRKANYKIQDKPPYAKSFIASVLYEHLQLDGIIFIGTVKSMWEEVYSSFCKEKGIECNQDYYFYLAEQVDKLDCKSSLDTLDLSELEEILGQRSKCILIKYGLDETELQENFDRIIKIIDFLREGDELYIDITHSFRSLSFFLFLVLTFINDLVSEKNIKIRGVYYGMLDIIREMNGVAPVVDLKPLFDLTQWIKGAYTLKTFGNGYLISELLQGQGEEELATQVHQLSEAININYLPAIEQRTNYLKSALQKESSSRPFKYIKNILEKFVQQFTVKPDREYDFQLKLAGWYFDNKRYATGYVTLAEAIITYVCEINGKNPGDKDERDEMKELLTSENKNRELAQLFFKVNPIRNAIAHALIDKKRASYRDAIANAKKHYEQAKKIFKTGTLGNLVR